MGRAEYRRKYLKYNSINNAKHYFTLPNEIFCLGLSSGEIAVYCYLLRCENRKTYQCYPSYRTIGKALKMTVHCYILFVRLQKLLITFTVSSCGETHNFKEIMKSRLKWGVSPRGHIRRQSRLLWGFTVCQKSEFEVPIKNERK